MAVPFESSILQQLKQKVDPNLEKQREEAVHRRERVQYERQQSRLAELIDTNSTRPVSISSITVHNANNTRTSFLSRILNPLLSAGKEEPHTFAEALKLLTANVDKLNRFDIFHSPIDLHIDRASATDPSTTPTDLAVSLSVREKSRLLLKSGTDVGSKDGSLYFNLNLRNLLGGAESLFANASFGTRTRSSYSGGFDTPILSNPDLRWEIGGLSSSTRKSWASHEEVLKGGSTKLKWITSRGHRHELGYQGMWRQVTGLAEKASPTIRADAGDSFKSSITHSWTNDRRDYSLLPTRGYLIKTTTEIAGLGPLSGDVAFAKLEVESQAAIPIPIPGYSTASTTGISLTAGLRGGLVYPLTLAGTDLPTQSRVNDRFTLGGPTDVRGFRFAGLGPRHGGDAVGGDVYAAGGASLLFPFPRVGADKPLRFQAFVNGGRLLALKDDRPQGDSTVKHRLPGTRGMTSDEVARSVRGTVESLVDELPSVAAGVGVVYALPVARFELNFSLPLVVRKGEDARKGLMLGVGISFL